MKNIVVLIVVAVAALLAYNFFTNGELSLMPSGPSSAEGRELMRLERGFEKAEKEFGQALRSAGMAGLDTTGDAEAAMDEARHVERDLAKLMPRLKAEDERRKAERLKMRIREFKRRAGA